MTSSNRSSSSVTPGSLDRTSHGLWEMTSPPAPACPSLETDVDTDVAIIGAGYTGLSAALHLRERNIAATVVEGSAIGFGGSGRNAGNVNAGLWLAPLDLLTALGDVYGERLLRLLSDAPAEVFALAKKYAIDCDPLSVGTLHCGVGAAGLQELTVRTAQWTARGAPVELLDKVETDRRTGTTAYAGSLLDRRAGTIQPLAYARGLADSALSQGAKIFTQSPVIDVVRQGAKWRVMGQNGSVTADWVIVATNAYTSSPFGAVRAELAHLPYFNIATAPLSEAMQARILPGREGAWDTKPVMTSFRLDRDGRLILGSVGALRGIANSVHRRWAQRTISRLFPYLGAVEFNAEWYGKIGMTNDHLPRFHKFAQNLIGFSGYNGRGIGPGTVFGRTLADLIAGVVAEPDLPLPLTPTASRPFGPLMESYYEQGAKIAHFLDARLPR
ncbi:MAG TPA: FAD-binding oxidoreductase [Devosia sp.]|nr:FAD-binding oxidoreductase [Devosia sp.]